MSRTGHTGCKMAELGKTFSDGVGAQNPVLVHALGVCSALAVTGFVATTLVMGAALLFVASISTLIVSLLRNLMPHRVRLIAQMLIVSLLVIIVHLLLRAFWFDMSTALGAYVGLIITNCLILGRCESCALRSSPLPAFLDGLGSAAGYSLVLLLIAIIREPLGHGTLLGMSVMPDGFMSVMLVAKAPGAFLAMGIVVWVVRSIWPEPQPLEHPEAH